jgi:hypothetical protein
VVAVVVILFFLTAVFCLVGCFIFASVNVVVNIIVVVVMGMVLVMVGLMVSGRLDAEKMIYLQGLLFYSIRDGRWRRFELGQK